MSHLLSKNYFFNRSSYKILQIISLLPCLLFSISNEEPAKKKELPLYYWQQNSFVNFGDYLSIKLVERIVGEEVKVFTKKKSNNEKKLLAIGSILVFALEGDVIWGTGINGKRTDRSHFNFSQLDIRAVRGPLTRQFLIDNFQIDCPEIYGDPALLVPYFFPEFQRKLNPRYEALIIPHYSEQNLFPKEIYHNVVYPTDPWNEVIEKITDSQLVISSSLHGLIIAEAFGIPARLLRVTENEPLLKYQDYYLGTRRPFFQYATSVQEAIEMGGEPPFQCDLQKLYDCFPFEYWENKSFPTPIFR
jgi:pyruvyltransferase